MSERIAAAVRDEPKRKLGLAAGFAVLIAAIVLLVSVLSGATGAAAKNRSVNHGGGQGSSLSQRQINAKVNHLIGEMTPAEKFGQLEMAGPSTPDGSDLAKLAEQGKIGTVL